MAEHPADPRAYELMVLVTPEVGDEALDTEIERISDLVTGNGGEVVRVKATNPWGRRRLAYPIQKHLDAYYVLYSISSQPGSLDEVEREMKLNNRILRYLLVRQDELEEEEDDTEEAEVEAPATDDTAEAEVESDGEEIVEPEAAADDADEPETAAADEDDETA